MKLKTSFLSLFLLALPLFAQAQEPGYPQVDTVVIRRDSLDTRRGVVRSIPDSIFFRYTSAAMFFRISMEEEMAFTSVETENIEVEPAVHLADPVERLAKARAYRLAYRFEDAARACQQAMMWADDDLVPEIEKEYDLITRALSLTDQCQTPIPVMKKGLTLKEFYLFFPLTDRSFRATPNAFDGGTSIIPTYIPKSAKVAYFSAPDGAGARNIYMSENRDSCWSAPALLNESMVTPGNEIAPMLSKDGKTLYFASDGLFGMGGYDLYKCRWDDETSSWGEPENLGFPFSSPADDYMLIEAEEGRYTIFASNRECSGDSVYVYVVKYDPDPVLKRITDANELLTLSMLVPSADEGHVDNVNIGRAGEDNNSGALYMDAFARKEELETAKKKLDREISELETRLEKMEEGEDRESLTATIAGKKEELKKVEEDLEAISNEFSNLVDQLSNSTSLNTGLVAGMADTEIVGAGEYALTKHRMGSALKVKVLPWQQHPKSVFKLTPVGKFGVDGTLPEDMYYQIFFMESKRRIYAEGLNGLNPVYERQTRRLQYEYYAGVFMSYQDALHALILVRNQGFADARIVAYDGASPISVEEALKIEAARVEEESTLLWP